jgi:hypothetical protein
VHPDGSAALLWTDQVTAGASLTGAGNSGTIFGCPVHVAVRPLMVL